MTNIYYGFLLKIPPLKSNVFYTRLLFGSLALNFYRTNTTKSLGLPINHSSLSVFQRRSLHTAGGPNESIPLEAYDQTPSTEGTIISGNTTKESKRLSVKATQIDTGETTLFSTKAQAARS